MSDLDAQRREHLRLANEVRVRRAAFKRQLRAGELAITDVLAEPPHLVNRMRVQDVLIVLPGMGRKKLERLFGQLQMSPTAEVGNLSVARRRQLLAYLAERCPERWVEWNAAALDRERAA